MTKNTMDLCPSPFCACDSCVTEYVKDWEDGCPIRFAGEYYSDEYTGPFESSTFSRYDDWN